MRIAICEDLLTDSKHLYNLISDYSHANALDVNIDIFNSGEDFLKSFKPNIYQIIFLDIYMNDSKITGMDVAKKIREVDIDASIIFTTMSLEHGVSSYQVDANYYIVKPVSKSEFEKAMEKCKEKIDLYGKTIDVMINREDMKIRLRDIYYLEAMSHNTIICTQNEEYSPNITLTKLKLQIGGFPFIQCHRSYIVNLLHVKKILDNEFILSNGDTVPISKGFKKDAIREFKNISSKLKELKFNNTLEHLLL